MNYGRNSITLEYIQWSDYNRKSSKTMDISNKSPCLFKTSNIYKMWWVYIKQNILNAELIKSR